MLRNEMAQLKDMPKGYDATVETHRNVHAPSYYTAPSSNSAAKKEVVIVKGKGEKLSEIPYIADQISSRKSSDKALLTLHHLAFGVPPKHTTVKKYLREFSGVVYGADNNRARMEARIGSRSLVLLRELCTLLGVHGASRADMIKNVADFLEKPVVTDAKVKKSSSKTSKKTEKKSSSSKSSKKSDKKSSKSSKKSSKKGKKAEGPKRPVSAYLLFCKAKRDEVLAANKGISNTDTIKKLGEMWKAADAATKKPFETAAAADKKRYEAECKKAKQ